jgi:hypothetical protein
MKKTTHTKNLMIAVTAAFFLTPAVSASSLTAAQYQEWNSHDKGNLYHATLRTAAIIANLNGNSTQANCLIAFPNGSGNGNLVKTQLDANQSKHPSYAILKATVNKCGKFKF